MAHDPEFEKALRRTYASLIRQMARKHKRQPCNVCGRHIEITELHHLIPVAALAKYLLNVQREEYPIITAWLCPNHHAYWHKLERSNRRERTRILALLNEGEAQRLLELWNLRQTTLHEQYGEDVLPDLPDEDQ